MVFHSIKRNRDKPSTVNDSPATNRPPPSTKVDDPSPPICVDEIKKKEKPINNGMSVIAKLRPSYMETPGLPYSSDSMIALTVFQLIPAQSLTSDTSLANFYNFNNRLNYQNQANYPLTSVSLGSTSNSTILSSTCNCNCNCSNPIHENRIPQPNVESVATKANNETQSSGETLTKAKKSTKKHKSAKKIKKIKRLSRKKNKKGGGSSRESSSPSIITLDSVF